MTFAISIGIVAIGSLFFLRWPVKGLALLLFLLPFSVALNPLPGFDVQLLRLLVPLFWFAAFLKYPRTFLRELKSRPALLLWLFLTVASLATLFAAEPSWALRKLIYLWSFVPLLPAITALYKEKPESVQQAVKFLLAGGAVVAVIGVVQFFAQFFFGTDTLFHFFVSLAPYIHGKEFGALVAEYPSWFVNIGGVDYLRAFAFFPDPHIFAFYLMFVYSLTLSLILSAETKKAFLVHVSCFMLQASCLLLTFSRGGYLGFLASTAVILTLFWRQQKKRAAPILAIAGLAIFMIATFAAPVVSRLASSFDAFEGSNMGRIEIWKDAAEKTVQNPFGVGLGNYAVSENDSVEFRNPITAHNLYLDVLVETGFPGFAAFLLFLAMVFYSLSKKASQTADQFSGTLAVGFLAALAGFSVHAFFENPLWSPAIFILLLFAATHTRDNS